MTFKGHFIYLDSGQYCDYYCMYLLLNCAVYTETAGHHYTGSQR